MQNFEKRMLSEYAELHKKCDKLWKFINNKNFKNLDVIEQKMITYQFYYMQGYLIKLEDRIKYRGLDNELKWG